MESSPSIFSLFFAGILCARIILHCHATPTTNGLDLLIVTVAIEETDGYVRFKQSIDTFGLNLHVFGMTEKCLGGDVSVTTGGTHKLNLLKQGLVEYKDRDDLVLLFTDSYNAIFAADKEEILLKFAASKSKLIISAQNEAWPRKKLKYKYPAVENGYPNLCSSSIIGYAPTFWKALNAWDVENDDDQLYFTLIYLNETLRNELEMTLDHTAQLIQNLNYAQTDVKIIEIENQSRLKNERFNTLPCVIHGNGPSKVPLNRIGNYVPNNFHRKFGCRQCDRDLFDLSALEILPLVQVTIFIPPNTDYLNEFFERILNLDYPKSRINIFIHHQGVKPEPSVELFKKKTRKKYNKSDYWYIFSGIEESKAMNMALEESVKENCKYQFTINANIQIWNPKILQFLMKKNKKIIAPLMNGQRFWDNMSPEGHFIRSGGNPQIYYGKYVGIWNVPCVSLVYLSKTSVLWQVFQKRGSLYNNSYSNIKFCEEMRNEGIFMYLTNEYDFGQRLPMTIVKQKPLHPDLWKVISNPKDWEDKYIHPGFWDVQMQMKDITQPCPDVFMFPLFTETMADHLVETANDYGRWSNGQNPVKGLELYPTRDVLMQQIGFYDEWFHILRTYPGRIVDKVYHTPMLTNIHTSFVARYIPTEQSNLEPHIDTSTWTINIALNTHGVDYEGGGCRFVEYNCSVTQMPKGYAIVHPGTFTHFHEGLRTTKGTRYICVSFVIV